MMDFTRRYKSIIARLKKTGHKLTPQRLAVVKALIFSEGHPNIEHIHKKVQEDFPTMSLATVYRNIILLKEMGEALEICLPDGSNRYDGRYPAPHPHVICIRCKLIRDPKLSEPKDLTTEVENQTGFTIYTHRMDFFGICDACRKK